jgi:hypothetical protein
MVRDFNVPGEDLFAKPILEGLSQPVRAAEFQYELGRTGNAFFREREFQNNVTGRRGGNFRWHGFLRWGQRESWGETLPLVRAIPLKPLQADFAPTVNHYSRNYFHRWS